MNAFGLSFYVLAMESECDIPILVFSSFSLVCLDLGFLHHYAHFMSAFTFVAMSTRCCYGGCAGHGKCV